MKPLYTWFALFFILLGIDLQGLHAQSADDDIYLINAYRLIGSESFTLDGQLNEPFWQNVSPVTHFTQQVPVEGGTPSQRTEVYIAYDDNNLYIGAKLFDDHPEEILAWQKRRNQQLSTDDSFRLILDTFNDGRSAYLFATNPAALRSDGLITVGQGINFNGSWDGIWDVKTTVNSEGWIVEMIIPFRTLDFNSANTVWGINFQRTVRRNNEEILWAGWRRHQGLFRPQNAGTLTGLTNLNQGVGLEFVPYASGRGRRNHVGSSNKQNDFNSDAGFDVSYNLTPSISTALTINTDFAETEVDQRRVNLTRFPLLFPEQRDFFLEGSSLFSFAPRSGVTPFFSRRIGLMQGEQVPIRAGLKVMGREGNTNMGLYQIRTGSTLGASAEDFTVARVSQNIFSESNVGFIYTRRATDDHTDIFNTRHTFGTDLELGTSSFLGNKNLQMQAYFVWHNPHTPDDLSSFQGRTSHGIRVNYPNFPFYARISYRELGSDFDPAVGFTRRNSFRRFQPTVGYQWFLTNNSWIRSWEVQTRFEYLTDLNFDPQTVNFTISPVEIQFESGEQFEASIRRDFERLHFDFDILRDGTMNISAGDYYNWAFDTEFSTANYRRVSAQIEFTHQGFWTGIRNSYGFSATIRPYPGINLTGNWTRSDIRLPERRFNTDLLRFRGNIDLSPNVAITNILQYDNLSELLGFFSRFRWTITPGSDLFLVYTTNWIQLDNRFDPIETEGAIKISYNYRF